MKESRPKKVVALPDGPEMEGGWGLVKKHLNTASTVLLLVLAGFMFVRWRMQTAANARILIGNDLSTAQTNVNKLRRGMFASAQSPADMIKAIEDAEKQASAAITNVVNSSDADDRMRAEAFVLRGDMYWYLANLPPLPGSESEPTLRLSESTDSLLQKATDSYQQVIKDSALSNEHEQVNIAHLGLEAIAENRGDWDTAQKELDAVIKDPKAESVLVEQAKLKQQELPTLKQPLYVVPPSGNASTQPTTMPMGPFQLPGLTTQPSTMPSTLPATTRTVMP